MFCMVHYIYSLCDAVANVLDCKIVISKFEFQLPYYIQFQAIIHSKEMNLLILPIMG